jgi:hypothetical protein
MTTTAILTLGYVKFALTPKKAAEINAYQPGITANDIVRFVAKAEGQA